MDIQELILTIVKPLVEDKEAVSLNIQDGEEYKEYHLTVAQPDLGHVIGRQGRIVQAIRTIIYSIPTPDGEKKVRLIVDESN